MSIESTLRALLGDPHLPQEAAESTLQQLLDLWRTHPAGRDAIEHAWRSCLSAITPRQPAGPQVSLGAETTRVCRVMSVWDFVKYHSAAFGLPFGEDGCRSLVRHLRDRGPISSGMDSPASSHRGITWTCLDEELRGVNLEDVESGLGLCHLEPGVELVAVSYTIPAAELRVPTVLDAALQPTFVPKSLADSPIPRAWDWAHGRWGLSEIVHRSDAVVSDPEVRALGSTSPTFRPYFNGAISISVPHSVALDNAVAEVLRRASAHRELEPFLRGERAVLELTPSEFERFLALLYQRRGYETILTKASWDGGFDIIALSDSRERAGLLIQAKRTTGSIGIRVIRELIGARFLATSEYARYVLVVATTGRFTRAAIDAEGQHPTQLRLMDYQRLRQELLALRGIGLRDIAHEAVVESRKAWTG